MDCNYVRPAPDGMASTTSYFKSVPAIMLNNLDIQQQITEAIERVEILSERFTRDGSGWIIDEIENVTLHTSVYDPIGGSSFIHTPDWIAHKMAVVNIQNKDEKCFLYCVLAVSHPQKYNAYRASHYEQYLPELNLQDLSFPLEIGQIPKFEANNSDYAINVMRIDDDEEESFAPLYATKYRNRKHLVWMLLLDEGEKRHYVLIRNLGRMLRGRNTGSNQVFPCPYCLYCFSSESGMQNHIDDCGKMGVQKVRYPEPPNTTLTFSNHQNQMEMPFVIYSDFESYLQKNEEEIGKSTKFCDTHTPSGFCCLTVSKFPEYNNEEPFIYSGDGDVVDAFFTHLNQERVRINEILKKASTTSPSPL